MSYFLTYLTLLASSVGVPIPEELTILAAGVLSAAGKMNPWPAGISCWLGSLSGDCLVYFLGHHFGKSFLRQHRLWAHLVTPEREERMEAMIRRHGLTVLFTSRFLVGVRGAVYLAAGILKVPFRRFFLTDLVSVTIITGVFFSLSYHFGTTIKEWLRRGEYLATAVLLLVAAGIALVLWRRHVKKKRTAE